MSDKSYGASYEFVINLASSANTRSYGPSFELTIDLDSTANTRSYGASREYTMSYTYVAPPPFKAGQSGWFE